MDCRDIQKLLPMYMEGLLSGDEKDRVEAHQASCTDCRAFLDELEKTRQLLKDMEEVEPPAWLSHKIMARVREEAEQKQGLLKRLFYPFHIKLPAQAIGMLVVAVLAFQVYRTIVPEMGITPEKSATEPFAKKTMPRASRQLPSQAPVPLDMKQQDEALGAKDKGPVEGLEQRRTPLVPPVTVAKGSQKYEKGLYSKKGDRESLASPTTDQAAALSQTQGAAAPEKQKIGVSLARGKEEESDQAASVTMEKAQERAAAGDHKDTLIMVVTTNDIDATKNALDQITAKLGIKTIETFEHSGGRVIVVQVPAEKLQDLSKKIKDLGQVKSLAEVSEPFTGDIMVRIEIMPH